MTIRQIRISSRQPPHRRRSTPPGTKIAPYQGIHLSSFYALPERALSLAKELHNLSQLYPDRDEYSRAQSNEQPGHPLQAPLYPSHPDQGFTPSAGAEKKTHVAPDVSQSHGLFART